MKAKIILSFVTLLFGVLQVNAHDGAKPPKSQEDTTVVNQAAADSVKTWKFTGLTSLNFNQMSFTNWAAGGDNTIAVTLLGNYSAIYNKNKWNWTNILDFGYGMIKTESKNLQKNDDRLSLMSKLGYRISPKLLASARFDFRTQFANGFEAPPADSIRNSTFMAPAWTVFALGVDYQVNPYLSFGFYPITNKTTFVLDQELADKGAFGVEKAQYNAMGDMIKKGEQVRMEVLGAYLTGLYKQTFKTVKVQSRLELFNNYTDKQTDNRVNIDVNWETTVGFQVTKWLATSFFLHILYDQNIPVKLYEKVNGLRVPTGAVGPRTQIKQVLGISLTYSFDTSKKK